ncbi:MAG: Calx-beta domain-containing protein [Microcystaceae cyanobacterium]
MTIQSSIAQFLLSNLTDLSSDILLRENSLDTNHTGQDSAQLAALNNLSLGTTVSQTESTSTESTSSDESATSSNLENDFEWLTANSIPAGEPYTSSETGSLPTNSIDGLLSAYSWGFSWGSNVITYSFYDADNYYGDSSMMSVSDGIKANVREIFDRIAQLINIEFEEVTEGGGQFGRIRFMLDPGMGNPYTDPVYEYAKASYPSTDNLNSPAGDIYLNPAFDYVGGNGFQSDPGNHGYTTLIHEIGHALGLKHPALSGIENNTTNTVMSYNNPVDQFGYYTAPGTFMAYDIAALQSLYGAKTHNDGDNYYQFIRPDQYQVDGQAFLPTSFKTKLTVWDSAGTDTFDLSQLAYDSSGYKLDLNPGGIFSTQASYEGSSYSVGGETYSSLTTGTVIAYDAWIENVILSGSDDEVHLNGLGNTIVAASGNDTIYNSDYLDTLDLSAYYLSEVSQAQSQQDLILGLGANGSITIKNYYEQVENERLNILYNTNSAPTSALSIADFTVNEGDGTATVTVSLSQAADSVVSVNYYTTDYPNSATSGADYTETSGELSFAIGETTAEFTVNIADDSAYEGTESFLVNLNNASSNAIINGGQAVGTIIDNDPLPSLSVADFSVNEGDGTVTVTVSLSQSIDSIVSVSYYTTDDPNSATGGVDYTGASGILDFEAGATEAHFTLNITDDSIVEGDEHFFINLNNPSSNATISDGQGVSTIVDNDSSTPALPIISINDVSYIEKSNRRLRSETRLVTVTLSEASTEVITVDYATSNDTALAGSSARNGADYIATSGTITFNPGETSQTFGVGVFKDRTSENDETFFLNFSNASSNAELGNSQATFTIIDDDNYNQPLSSENDNLLNYRSSNTPTYEPTFVELDDFSLGMQETNFGNESNPLSQQSALESLSTVQLWDFDTSVDI